MNKKTKSVSIDELKEMIRPTNKVGNTTNKIGDKRLRELIDIRKKRWGGKPILIKECAEIVDTNSALQELQTLRQQNKELQAEVNHLTAYADKLIEPLDYLPKDIENIRKANFRLHEVEQQNKALIEDSKRLAKEYKDVYTANDLVFDGGVEDAIKQHDKLMQEIGEK